MRLGGYEVVQKLDRTGAINNRLQLSQAGSDFRRTNVALLANSDFARGL